MAAGLPQGRHTRKIATPGMFYIGHLLLAYIAINFCSTCTDRDVDICTEIACNVVNPGGQGQFI